MCSLEHLSRDSLRWQDFNRKDSATSTGNSLQTKSVYYAPDVLKHDVTVEVLPVFLEGITVVH